MSNAYLSVVWIYVVYSRQTVSPMVGGRGFSAVCLGLGMGRSVGLVGEEEWRLPLEADTGRHWRGRVDSLGVSWR